MWKTLAVLLLPLLGCAASSGARTGTLRGQALDAKGGAVLRVGDETLYIAGLQAWPPELAGKTVLVTGTVTHKKLIPDPVVNEKGEHSAGAVGEQTVIENATWKEDVPAP